MFKRPKKPRTLAQIKKKALEILNDPKKYKDVYFFCDLAIELGYSRQYLYSIGLDKDDAIKEALENNKKTIKRGLRNKWYINDNATTQVALYKLLADEEELNRLASKVENTGNVTLTHALVSFVDGENNGSGSEDTE